MLITQENIDWLARNDNLISLYDNSYLKNTDNENYKYIKQKFFRHELEDTVKTLNVGTGLFSTICDIPADYTSNPISDDKVNILQSTADIKIFKYGLVGLIVEEDETGRPTAKAISVPATGWFPQDGISHVLRCYKSTRHNSGIRSFTLGGGSSSLTDYYVLIQSYHPGVTVNKLYRQPTPNLLTGLQEVPLDTIQETSHLEENMFHPFDGPSLYLIREDNGILYPVNTDMEKERDKIYSLERKKVMYDCEFLQNVESFVLFKGIKLPPKVVTKYQNGTRIDINDLGRMVEGEENASIEFINNTNTLIEKAINYKEKEMADISSSSKIPLDFLGVSQAHGVIGKGSRSLLHGAFTKHVTALRSIWDKFLPSIYVQLSKFNGTDPSYTWPDIFSSSDAETADEMKVALDAGLISQDRAIQTYLGLDQEEAANEMLKILEEKKLLATIESNGDQTIANDEGTEGEQDDTVIIED